MRKKKLSIAVFGSYDERVLSTRVILSGLTSYSWPYKIFFVHEQIPSGVLHSPHHLGLFHIIRRIYRRLRAQTKLLFRFRELFHADVIIVLPFGLIDLLQAWIYQRLGKSIIYIPQNSLYDLFLYALDTESWIKPFAGFVYQFERFLWRIPDCIVFNTQREVEWHKKLLNLPDLKTAVVPLGADDSIFKPQKRTGRKSKFNVLFYGEYNVGQGTLIIAKAAAMLKRYKRIRFTMIGGGKMRDATLVLARKLKASNITFVNWVSPQVLTEYIREADVVLGMFKDDALVRRVIPNKVYQGMASKRAVITAQSPAVSSWFTHKKDVFIVEPDNHKSLAKGIVTLMRSGRLRNKIAKGGYNAFKKRYSRKPVTAQLIEVIDTVLIAKRNVMETVAEQNREVWGY